MGRRANGLMLAAALTGAASLVACASTPPPRITSGHPAVPGILEAAGAQRLREVVVFVTHGMGATPQCFADDVAEMLGAPERTGCSAPPLFAPVCLGRDYQVTGDRFRDGVDLDHNCRKPADGSAKVALVSAFGRLEAQRFETRYGGQPITVRLYSYNWNDDALLLQAGFLKADAEAAGERVRLNRQIKQQVINDGFSDAVLYNGSFGPVMRQGVRSALCRMALDFAGETPIRAGAPAVADPCRQMVATGANTRLKGAHLALLTSSLGSRLLFDALDEKAATGTVALADTVISSAPVIYMSANQLPLLAIGQLTVTPATATAAVAGPEEPDFLARYLRGSAGGEAFVPANRIVAFYDPNDLLGYRAGGHLPDAERANIIEVTQVYARRWLGLFAHPLEAHDQSFKDAAARRLIACGGRQTEGRLVANRCPP